MDVVAETEPLAIAQKYTGPPAVGLCGRQTAQGQTFITLTDEVPINQTDCVTAQQTCTAIVDNKFLNYQQLGTGTMFLEIL